MVRRYVVVGGSGMVARRIGHRLLQKQAPFVVTSSSGASGALALNLAHPMQFEYESLRKGDVIFLLAAISRPDICQKDAAYCRKVNIEGTQEFALRAMARGAKIVFASSDTVYGETETAVDESANLNPVGEYGRMKAEVECRLSSYEGFSALRLSYVVAYNDKFTSYLANCVRSRQVAELFHPLNRCPVHIDDVVDAFIAQGSIMQEGGAVSKVLNVGGPALMSRDEMAAAYKSVVASELQWRVVEPPHEFYAARPRTIHMQTDRLSSVLGRGLAPVYLAWKRELEFEANLVGTAK